MMAKALTLPVLALCASLVSCVPWTVRPIASEEKKAATPAAYVDSIWQTRLLPAVRDAAVEARTLLDAMAASPAQAESRYGRRAAGGACYFIVKGRGAVTAVDARSRVGLALVDVPPFDRRPDVSIQIGPVLRGTSLRDATGIVRFTDFVNQLHFADAGNEINQRVLETVLAPIDTSRLSGRTVSFVGTLEAREKTAPPLPDLVPVSLTLEEPR